MGWLRTLLVVVTLVALGALPVRAALVNHDPAGHAAHHHASYPGAAHDPGTAHDPGAVHDHDDHGHQRHAAPEHARAHDAQASPTGWPVVTPCHPRPAGPQGETDMPVPRADACCSACVITALPATLPTSSPLPPRPAELPPLAASGPSKPLSPPLRPPRV